MPKKHVLGWHNLLPFNTISHKLKSGFRPNSKAYVLIFCLAIKKKKYLCPYLIGRLKIHSFSILYLRDWTKNRDTRNWETRKGRGPSDKKAEKEGKKGTEYGKHQNVKKKRGEGGGWGVRTELE